MARKAEYATITPARAKEILDASNRNNRPLMTRKVEAYADAMKREIWDSDNSTAISIDVNGDLVNGHHRLLACIEAGVPFQTLLITGVKPEVFSTEDSGAPRTIGSYLSILGNSYATLLGSTTRLVRLWEQGRWALGASGGSKLKEFLTPEDFLEEIEARPTIRKGVQFIGERTHVFANRMPKAFASALYALTAGHPRHNDFWQELADGINMPSDSPVKILRHRMDTVRSGHLLTRNVMLALLTKCWNAYATNTKVTRLSYGEAKSENFPQPITRLKPRLIDVSKKSAE